MGLCKSTLNFNEELSKTFTNLWKCDENACKPVQDFKLNTKKKSHKERNLSNDRLFVYFRDEILSKKPSYATFCKLLDIYTNFPEVVRQTNQEVNNFLSAILKTKVMKEAHKYLVKKKKSSEDLEAFQKQLHDIWFKFYRRHSSGKYSCGFKHVFVGEIEGNKVVGFHNWISLYLQEREGKLDYHGFYDNDKSFRGGRYIGLLTFSFSWKNVLKKRSSLFIGTSPELEIAIYTIAFLCQSDETSYVKINDLHIELIVFNRGKGIDTAFPKCLKHGAFNF